MEVNILDVAHGSCACIVADNRNVILIDCGKNEETGYQPSSYLRDHNCSGIELFIVTNYDEDHLSDLPNVWPKIPIQSFLRNTSISGEDLRRLKLQAGPLGPGMESLLRMIGPSPGTSAPPIDFSGIERKSFWNDFSKFPDTNNMSIVIFFHYCDIHIVFPGDLEREGWLALLERAEFQSQLKQTNFFVASHHGRDSGYCEEVFSYCKPYLILISDKEVEYDTQEVPYKKHAKGWPWHDGSTRYVLTTRNDGKITLTQNPGEGIKISTTK